MGISLAGVYSAAKGVGMSLRFGAMSAPSEVAHVVQQFLASCKSLVFK
jgi:hypothetical protein